MFKLFNNKKDTPANPSTTPDSASAEAPKSGFFSRMKQAVSHTRESFSAKIENLVALTHTVDDGTLKDLESALLTSDLGVQTTNAILEALRDRARIRPSRAATSCESCSRPRFVPSSKPLSPTGPVPCRLPTAPT
jgi:signal recognition particle GTPase